MCTISPPDPLHEAPPTPWLKVGWCTGTQAAHTSTRNAASAGDRVAWAPTLNLGCGVTSLTKLHRLFFAPTGHPFQGRLLLESTLRFRIYAADPTWGTHHGENDPWCVTSKVASRAKLQMFFARTRTKPHRVFSHLPVTRFRVVSSLKALPCRPLSSPVVPACRPLCFCVVPCRPRIFKIKII